MTIAALAYVYPWTKALHVISVIAWMAGLFYLPRLFVYHAEQTVPEELFQTMERRLLRAIMNPAMTATWIFGLCLVFTPGLVDWSEVWPWTKAAAVLASACRVERGCSRAATSIVFPSESKPSAATSASSADLSSKWLYGAMWLTPVRRATSRSVKSHAPSSVTMLSAVSISARRRSPW